MHKLRESDREREFLAALELLSPGTELREGIDYILQAGIGGLIVIGESPNVLELTEGGFEIDCEFSSTRLYQLAKMDGAIILSEDLNRIVRANAYLRPSSTFTSRETGMRHQTAEKVSKQTGKITLAVSQRRNTVTLYLKHQHYLFRGLPVLISGANQTMLALNRYLEGLSSAIAKLDRAELSGTVTLVDVVTVIQRMEMVRRAESDLNRYQIELGNEGQSLQLRPPELTLEVEEALLVILDYYRAEQREEDEVFERIFKLDAQALADRGNISVALGFPRDVSTYMETIEPRGYRLLSQIPRLPISVIENVVKTFKTLSAIYDATMEDLQAIEGVGEVRAAMIKDLLVRMKCQKPIEKWLMLPDG
ncbi:DNA integrity scanning protein DisA [Candidatus Poribacteria bacterium]|nr:DNA integrity scanning protein DisA [Candidatus Poribacteria bacterium]